MATFDYRAIRTAIASSEQGKKRVQTVMDNKLKEHKDSLIEAFDNHPVTEEIEKGQNNISNTLDGHGNLRGFIGFPEGEDPIAPVREILRNEVSISRKTIKVEGDKIKYKYSLKIPKESLRAATPLPWEQGLSWLFGIENGRISGLAYYLTGKFKSPEPSRSGQGVQAKQAVRGSTFKKVPYLSQLFDRFIAKFK